MTVRVALVDQLAWQGGRLYVENLARSLIALPADQRPDLVWLGDERALHRSLRDVRRARVRPPSEGRLGHLRGVATTARDHGADFVYPFPGKMPGPRAAHWIPDLQHYRLPMMFSRRQRLQRDLWFRACLVASSDVVLSSDAARRDLVEMSPRLARLPRLEVLRFATPLEPGDVDVAGADFVRVRESLPERYVYLPNQMWRHKDHGTAFRALHLLQEQGLTVHLALTGSLSDYRNPGWAAEMQALVTELGIANQLHFLGELPRTVQLGVMYHASVVLQPSLFEGWSTVLEDARALARPVLASRIDTHLEQDVTGTVYFEPGDAEDLARRLGTCWSESECALEPFESLVESASIRSGRVADSLLHIARRCAS